MQGPTHLVTGILIQKTLRKIQPLPFQYFLVAFFCIVSHGILDKSASITYHPPKPLTRDWFWICSHLFIALLTVYICLTYWGKYKFALVFSVLPDFDWILLQGSKLFPFQISFLRKPILHRFFFSFFDSVLPFKLLNTLPDWNLQKKGVILEFCFFCILVILIYFI